MTEEQKIRQLLYSFEHAGLIEKSTEQLLGCFSEHILGIGLGEQGFVTSLEDVKNVFEAGLKEEDSSTYSLDFGRVEILTLQKSFAVVCAEVRVNAHSFDGADEKIIRSQFQQTLVTIKECGEWKICGLHASIPIITEEYMEAYPLKIAEKTLNSLREKIGEEVYLAEEQYRKAVLADAIAFYIINFSADRFEKCHLQNDICVYVDSGTPYEQFVTEKTTEFIIEEDRSRFLKSLSLKSIHEAYEDSSNEVSCEYRMKFPDGSYVWTKTIIRLITDVVSGDRKGIMYVKNIDEDKRESMRIREKADYDAMTKLLNKGAMMREVDRLIRPEEDSPGGTFLMVDVDNFKTVNDTFGHPAGDQVLISVANILRETFGTSAQIGRLGGDEFGVFLPGEPLNKPLKMQIDSLLSTVHQFRLPEIPKLSIAISVGGVYKTCGDFETLYRAADTALYQAKKSGKNRAAYL